MDKSSNPYSELDLDALAQACDERAEALHARAWHNECERNALREATAELLSAVAQQLAAGPLPPAPVRELSSAELREIIRDRVEHAPLHGAEAAACGEAPRHAWIQEFVPGGEDAAGR